MSRLCQSYVASLSGAVDRPYAKGMLYASGALAEPRLTHPGEPKQPFFIQR